MKNVFHGLTSRLDTAEERITEFKDLSRHPKLKKQSEQRVKEQQQKKNRTSKNFGTTTIFNIHRLGIPQE